MSVSTHFFSYIGVSGGVSGDWILATGFWVDSGEWVDTEVWSD